MDNNLYFDSVKPEKSMAMNMMMTYNYLKRIAKYFRTLEISLSIFFLIYLSTHLPLVLKLSGEYFRRLSSTLTSPLSIFLILNTLVLFLYQNYNNATPEHHDHQGEYSNSPDPSYTTTSLNEDSIDRCDRLCDDLVRCSTALVVYQDKEVICEDKEKPVNLLNKEMKDYRRSQSSQGQGKKKIEKKNSGKVLRRSKTEEMMRCKEMELSNEEFRRTIEEFLEKQKKFHHLEKLSTVVV